MSEWLPPHISPDVMAGVWEALAKLEARRRVSRVNAALFRLGARELVADFANPDALLDRASNIAEAADAEMEARELVALIASSRREHLDAGIPAESIELGALQAWAKGHWNPGVDPYFQVLLQWLGSAWDDERDLPVEIVDMIRRVDEGKTR